MLETVDLLELKAEFQTLFSRSFQLSPPLKSLKFEKALASDEVLLGVEADDGWQAEQADGQGDEGIPGNVDPLQLSAFGNLFRQSRHPVVGQVQL